MLIAVEIAEVYSVPGQTFKMNLFVKDIYDYKGKFKPCQTSEIRLF